jgi:hypothetical protein
MLFFALLLAAAPADAPLPKIEDLRQRSLATAKRTAAAQENYSCRLRAEEIETDKDGNPKKTKVSEREQFFVNGHPVSRLIAKDGKPLSAGDEEKEAEHTRKEVEKYSDMKNVEKERREEEKQMEYILKTVHLSNERRVQANGRSAIALDVEGDPKAPTHSVEERFLQAMKGTLVLDESTGEVTELDIHTVRDVKAGFGLANLHKGMWVHIKQSPHPDGVWLTDLAEGSGDARAALFFHPYFRFKETRSECHLYNVEVKTADATIKQ